MVFQTLNFVNIKNTSKHKSWKNELSDAGFETLILNK